MACCQPAPKHEPAANRSLQFPRQGAMARRRRPSRVKGQQRGGFAPCRPDNDIRPRRANRPCPNNVAPPPNCPCVFASLRSWLPGSRGEGCFPMPFERLVAKAPGLGMEGAVWREAPRNGRIATSVNVDATTRTWRSHSGAFNGFMIQSNQRTVFQDGNRCAVVGRQAILHVLVQIQLCGGGDGARRPSRRQTCCRATTGK